MNIPLILALSLTAAVCEIFAQTNSLPPEKREAYDKFIERARAEMLAAQPVHAQILVYKGETRCQALLRGRTNVIGYLPLPEELFEAHLFDKTGNDIPKAWFNGKFGQPLKPDKNLIAGSFAVFDGFRGHSRRLDFSNVAYHHWDFDVAKSFRIKEPGEYRLQVQVRLFVKDTNGVFQPFILPPVETSVTISEAELR